jgi:hypothetical protein
LACWRFSTTAYAGNGKKKTTVKKARRRPAARIARILARPELPSGLLPEKRIILFFNDITLQQTPVDSGVCFLLDAYFLTPSFISPGRRLLFVASPPPALRKQANP